LCHDPLAALLAYPATINHITYSSPPSRSLCFTPLVHHPSLHLLQQKSPVASFDRSIIAPSLYNINSTNTHITTKGNQRTNLDHVVFKIHRAPRHIRHAILTRKRQPSSDHRRVKTTLGFFWQQHIQCEWKRTFTNLADLAHNYGSHPDTPARLVNP
jgi:hypothetical protein